MRCKRCGEILNPGDSRCPVCGKTLTPPRKRPQPAKSPENNIKLPQLDRFTHTYHQDAARSRTMQTLTIAAAAAALVLLVLVYTGLGKLQGAVGQLQQDAEAILQGQQEQIRVPTVPEETVTEPPANTRPLPLSQQPVEASLTLYRGAGGTYAAAAMALGDSADRAAAWVSTGEALPDRHVSASWILEGSADRLDVKLSDSYSGAEGGFFAALNWSLDGDVFTGYADPMCIWEYRTAGGEWESVPVENITAVPGGCEVRLTPEDLSAMFSAGTAMEMRCHVSMTHADGGSLKLAVTGIALNAEGLTVSGGLLD